MTDTANKLPCPSSVEALSQLQDIACECSAPDWNGEDALPVGSAAIQNAKDFIRALPEDVPAPECAPEPDGAVCLDWLPSRRHTFSLSVSGGNRVAYAWLNGAEQGHGTAHFDGSSVPECALAKLRLVLGH